MSFAFLKLFEEEENCTNCNSVKKKVLFLQIKDRLDDILDEEIRNDLINEVFENLVQEIVSSDNEFSMCIRGDIEDVPHIHLNRIRLSDFERKSFLQRVPQESLAHLFQFHLVFEIRIFN